MEWFILCVCVFYIYMSVSERASDACTGCPVFDCGVGAVTIVVVGRLNEHSHYMMRWHMLRMPDFIFLIMLNVFSCIVQRPKCSPGMIVE